jgi:hypothetical protein
LISRWAKINASQTPLEVHRIEEIGNRKEMHSKDILSSLFSLLRTFLLAGIHGFMAGKEKCN